MSRPSNGPAGVPSSGGGSIVLAAALALMLLFAATLNAVASAGGPGLGRSVIVVAAVVSVAFGALLVLRVRHRMGRR